MSFFPGRSSQVLGGMQKCVQTPGVKSIHQVKLAGVVVSWKWDMGMGGLLNESKISEVKN
jgi:hypothetical protein